MRPGRGPCGYWGCGLGTLGPVSGATGPEGLGQGPQPPGSKAQNRGKWGHLGRTGHREAINPKLPWPATHTRLSPSRRGCRERLRLGPVQGPAAEPWAMLTCGDGCLRGSTLGPRDRHCGERVLGSEVGQTVRSEVREPNPALPLRQGTASRWAATIYDGRKRGRRTGDTRTVARGWAGQPHFLQEHRETSGASCSRPGHRQLVRSPPTASRAEKSTVTPRGHSPCCGRGPAGAECWGSRRTPLNHRHDERREKQGLGGKVSESPASRPADLRGPTDRTPGSRRVSEM